ncbi:MAG: hypothetical protein JXA03_15010 [Bacteroidales bacterium]|nr:hypothetical protein [Bacteroidales bacterium]
MKTQILYGSPLKDRIFAEIAGELEALKRKSGKRPGIAFVAITGFEPLMKYTIALHEQAAHQLGFFVKTETRPADIAEQELFRLIDNLNEDQDIHAVVLLQPVPVHLDAIRTIGRIHPEKEVEGFHPENLAAILAGDHEKIRCPMVLPTSLTELFRDAGYPEAPADSEFVFLADDEFFERPFTNMVIRTACLQVVPRNCTATFVSSGSSHLREHCRRADFLFVISKRPGFVQPSWLKQGVCIVDVYSNLVKEIVSKKNPGVILPVIRGGVLPEDVEGVAGIIASCPGGLMPVVLAVLFRNALRCFAGSIGIHP